MSKLKELEKRLRDEPENLGLRVMFAGALREAGRLADAVELYRSVAIAYREQGRVQQAITVCRSILELAPGDLSCQALLALLVAKPAEASEPEREGTGGPTPLPVPLPYHVADPTGASPRKLTPADLPPSLRADLERHPQVVGIASAARQISESLLATKRWDDADDARQDDEDLDATEDELQQVSRASFTEVDPDPSLLASSFLTPVPGDGTSSSSLGGVGGVGGVGGLGGLGDGEDEDEPTLLQPEEISRDRVVEDRPTLPLVREPRAHLTVEGRPTLPLTGTSRRARSIDEEHLITRELPVGVRPAPGEPPPTATDPLGGAFFAPVPPQSRAAVLQRFRRQWVAGGTTVIRRGETGHGFVIVLGGRLELHADRPDGARVLLGAILPGEYVGEASLLARAPVVAQVVATVDSELLVLAASDFYEITGAFPALAAALRGVAERRTREHDERRRG